MSNVTQLLKQLIAIPSVNPLDADEPKWTHEGRICNFIKDWAEAKGLSIEWLEFTAGRPNLLVTLGPESANKSLMIEVHTDTVSVANMSVDPFEALEKDGRIYGRGACDNKGPMATLMACIDNELITQVENSDLQLRLAFTMGEEKGLLGAYELVAHGYTADKTVVLEPTGLAPVIAHKGCLTFEVKFNGIAGHASAPEKGLNAIEAAGHFMQRVRADEKEFAVTFSDEWKPSTSFGIIKGGSGSNIIPDECSLTVDRRYLASENIKEVIHSYEKILTELVAAAKLSSYTIIEQGEALNFFEEDEQSELVQQLQESIHKFIGERKPYGTGWCSDAVPFSTASKNVVVWGPGDIAQAHTKDEFIEITQLSLGESILKDFIISQI